MAETRGRTQKVTDIVDSSTRSRMMSKIKGKDTKPERLVRSVLHAAGYRFRLHRKNLPGKPDIILPKHRAAVFVNGCFWHGHECPLFRWPKSRESFWREKIMANVSRDQGFYPVTADTSKKRHNVPKECSCPDAENIAQNSNAKPLL